MLLSAPFMFMLERGNSVIFVLICLLSFFLFYDSESKIKKHLSLIFLAIATAFGSAEIPPFIRTISEDSMAASVPIPIACRAWSFITESRLYTAQETSGSVHLGVMKLLLVGLTDICRKLPLKRAKVICFWGHPDALKRHRRKTRCLYQRAEQSLHIHQ